MTAVSASVTAETTTDEWGNYSLWGLPLGEQFRVRFEDPLGRYDTEWFENAETEAAATPVPATRDGYPHGVSAYLSVTTVSGTVTDGLWLTPVAGIEVTAVGATSSYSATTDAAGNYTIHGLATGTYRVQFRDPSTAYSPNWYPSSIDAAHATPLSIVRGTATTGIHAALFTTSISGKVRDGSLRPIAGVEVSAIGSGSNGSATTAADGTYVISGLTTDRYRVRFSDPESGITEWFYDQPDDTTANEIWLTGAGRSTTSTPSSGPCPPTTTTAFPPASKRPARTAATRTGTMSPTRASRTSRPCRARRTGGT